MNLTKKLKLEDDEMNLAQFLELHRLEAKNGESVELWMALWTMGNFVGKRKRNWNQKLFQSCGII